ncbi:MAG: hypothetical protein R8K20_11715 [Gallionellaceae bacterium]
MQLYYVIAAVGFIYAGFWARRYVQVKNIRQVDVMGKQTDRIGLRYFSALEFGSWWPLMSIVLLQKLDALREAWGDSIIISPAMGSLGRPYPPGHSNWSSRHNITKYGEVQAADIMPQVTEADGTKRSLNKQELKAFYNMAVAVGFTGVGAYPDWVPYAGLHVDVRDDRSAGDPATWSGIKTAAGQEYFGVERAFT